MMTDQVIPGIFYPLSRVAKHSTEAQLIRSLYPQIAK